MDNLPPKMKGENFQCFQSLFIKMDGFGGVPLFWETPMSYQNHPNPLKNDALDIQRFGIWTLETYRLKQLIRRYLDA